jgi:hypothetical protein
MTRDLTDKQFNAALARHGMFRVGFLGYVGVTMRTHVSMHNAPRRTNRARLAYLLKAQVNARAQEGWSK